ncbi:hypothetical protein JOE31_000301 [Arthrobacter sp. PvP023]|nr:hypothetical protein [Arthrobacter sp. PvP023]
MPSLFGGMAFAAIAGFNAPKECPGGPGASAPNVGGSSISWIEPNAGPPSSLRLGLSVFHVKHYGEGQGARSEPAAHRPLRSQAPSTTQSTALEVRMNRHVSGDPAATAAKTGPFHAVRALSAIQVGVAPQPNRQDRRWNVPRILFGQTSNPADQPNGACRPKWQVEGYPMAEAIRPAFHPDLRPGFSEHTRSLGADSRHLMSGRQIRPKIDVRSASGATRD